jgi:hypothetical protein
MTDFEEQSRGVTAPDNAEPVAALDEDAQNSRDDALQPARDRAFEDLTLADVVNQFVFAPADTWRKVVQVAKSSPNTDAVQRAERLLPPARQPFRLPQPLVFSESAAVEDTPDIRHYEALLLGIRLCALILAVIGTGIMATRRFGTANGLVEGTPFVLIGFALWIAGEGLARRGKAETMVDTAPQHLFQADSESIFSVSWPRAAFAALGVVCSLQTWNYTTGNIITTEGFWFWIASIVLWAAALVPSYQVVYAGWAAIHAKIRGFQIRSNWTLVALVLIVLLGAIFRLSNLRSVPPEMTSDHVEKLLDAQRVLDGTHQIFFSNNGGREPFQMYAMALFSQLPGLSMSFPTLKLLSVLEGLITLPVLWWMGRAVIGDDDPKLGNLVGLALAGLVAASYWHTGLSRLALRIVMTPLVTGLLIIFLSRALRHNQRSDYIKAGLVLGFGLYTYQAVRMLPVVVLLGIGLALLLKARSLRTAGVYLYNLGVLVVIAGIVFVPMLHFWVEYPDDFWRRTSGRLLGDDLIQTTDESGQLIERTATLDERLAAFRENVPILLNNLAVVLLMFNWKGDVAWINGAPNRPAMDPLTGALLIVGLAAWTVLMWRRRRDPVIWLMPAMLFIMLLPSALSIAYPVENPSATRTSGALPEAYLFAALPLALFMRSTIRLAPGRQGVVFAGGFLTVAALVAFSINSNLYFGTEREEYLGSYLTSSLPYSEAGRALTGFANSGGGYGNAFMIAYPYWWDHRAVGIEAGLMDWPNGIVTRDDILRFMSESAQRVDRYRFDPERDILFLYSPADFETQALLKEWFPKGYEQIMTSYQPEDSYAMFRVPRLGQESFVRLIEMRLTGQG